MPRNGKLVRITLAARCGCGSSQRSAVTTAGAASAKSTSATLSAAPAARSSRRSCTKWAGPGPAAAGASQLNYSAVGSGGGVAAITNKHGRLRRERRAALATVQPDLQRAAFRSRGRSRRPSVFYNLPRLQELLHMTGSVLAKIYMGKITNWNDPAIKKLNQGKNLPSTRSRSSTALTARARRTTSPTTSRMRRTPGRAQVGTGTAVDWPTGDGRAAAAPASPVSSGRRPARSATPTSYYARQEPPAVLFKMKNRSGRFVRPVLAKAIARLRRSSTRTPRRTARSRSSIRPRARSTGTPTRSHLHVRRLSQKSSARSRRAPEARQLGDHEGTEVRAEAASSSRSRKPIVKYDKKADQEDPLVVGENRPSQS